MKNTDNGAKTQMAPAFGNFTDSMPSSALFWVLATLLFTTGVGTITVGTITPADALITEMAVTAVDASEPAEATLTAAAPHQPGPAKTKALKTEYAVESSEAAAEPAAPARATAVDQVVEAADLAEVNNLKKKDHDNRISKQRMDERSSSLWHLFGQFPHPPIPW
jgi:hypothetical protein